MPEVADDHDEEDDHGDAEVVDVDEEPAERTAVLVDTVAPLWTPLQPHDRVRALVATGGTN